MRMDRKRIAGVLIALNLAFIWGNSMRTGTASQDMSEGVLDWLELFLHLGDFAPGILHHLLRKAAHFTEFACLGALLAWYSLLREEKHNIALPALLGMAAALVDETIQLFTPDRGPSLSDVWLDTAGAVAGIMLLLLGHHLIKRKHNRSFWRKR